MKLITTTVVIKIDQAEIKDFRILIKMLGAMTEKDYMTHLNGNAQKA